MKPQEFLSFVNSVLKIVPSAKFSVDSDGCVIRSVNESGTVKAFFTIKSVKSKERMESKMYIQINIPLIVKRAILIVAANRRRRIPGIMKQRAIKAEIEKNAE